MKNKGFTLIELLITIAIIGILASAAVTAYIGTTKKATRSEAYANLESLRLLEEQFFADRGEYTPDPAVSLGTCAKDNRGNIAIIKGELPGFKPGNDTSFSYCIEGTAIDLEGIAADPSCFIARAFGNSNTRVTGDEFAIDCNNNRTF